MRSSSRLVCFLLPLVAGCANVDRNYVPVPGQDSLMVRAVQFPDIPVPAGLQLQVSHNESASFAAGDFRWAVLHYRGKMSMARALSFLKEQLVQFQWRIVSQERPGPGELVLQVEKPWYVAQFRLRQMGTVLHMDVYLNTRLRTGEGKPSPGKGKAGKTL